MASRACLLYTSGGNSVANDLGYDFIRHKFSLVHQVFHLLSQLGAAADHITPVSYTHLDVYKRQAAVLPRWITYCVNSGTEGVSPPTPSE